MRLYKVCDKELKDKIIDFDSKVKECDDANLESFSNLFPYDFDKVYAVKGTVEYSHHYMKAIPKDKVDINKIPKGWQIDPEDNNAICINRRTKEGREIYKKLSVYRSTTMFEFDNLLGLDTNFEGSFTIPNFYIKENGDVFVSLDARIDLTNDSRYVESNISEFEKVV